MPCILKATVSQHQINKQTSCLPASVCRWLCQHWGSWMPYALWQKSPPRLATLALCLRARGRKGERQVSNGGLMGRPAQPHPRCLPSSHVSLQQPHTHTCASSQAQNPAQSQRGQALHLIAAPFSFPSCSFSPTTCPCVAFDCRSQHPARSQGGQVPQCWMRSCSTTLLAAPHSRLSLRFLCHHRP